MQNEIKLPSVAVDFARESLIELCPEREDFFLSASDEEVMEEFFRLA